MTRVQEEEHLASARRSYGGKGMKSYSGMYAQMLPTTPSASASCSDDNDDDDNDGDDDPSRDDPDTPASAFATFPNSVSRPNSDALRRTIGGKAPRQYLMAPHSVHLGIRPQHVAPLRKPKPLHMAVPEVTATLRADPAYADLLEFDQTNDDDDEDFVLLNAPRLFERLGEEVMDAVETVQDQAVDLERLYGIPSSFESLHTDVDRIDAETRRFERAIMQDGRTMDFDDAQRLVLKHQSIKQNLTALETNGTPIMVQQELSRGREAYWKLYHTMDKLRLFYTVCEGFMDLAKQRINVYAPLWQRRASLVLEASEMRIHHSLHVHMHCLNLSMHDLEAQFSHHDDCSSLMRTLAESQSREAPSPATTSRKRPRDNEQNDGHDDEDADEDADADDDDDDDDDAALLHDKKRPRHTD